MNSGERVGVGPYRVVSVNVSRPQTIQYFQHTVVTGIFKTPVAGRVMVRRANVDGDEQADTRVIKGRQVHGGPLKAVYVYAAEHYETWERELGRALAYGQFGENLTAEGMFETDIHIGDVLQFGGAVLRVTEPRLPCYKLDIKMGQPEFMKSFLASGRTGFYTEVLEEGEVAAGDLVRLMRCEAKNPTVLEATRSTHDLDAQQ